MPEPLNHVLLSFPSVIELAARTSPETPPRSWVQLARVGSFTSNRYGKFSITKDDLSTMLHNFDNVTPKSPTELPIDYDHLSMDPKKPGDGVAAGWMKKLELREEGTELWAQVEWTPDGAERIEKKEYRFVSPSFVKDHVHKDGKKIGTTLIAAAITNHPFLEGMKALTLYSFSALGDLATETTETPPETVHLMEGSKVGQRVVVNDADEDEWTAEERTTTFIIKTEVGEGDDRFVTLVTLDGRRLPGWRRATQLGPAPAPNKDKESPMPAKTTVDPMQQLMADARQLVAANQGPMTLGDATKVISLRNEPLAKAYLKQFDAAPEEPEVAAPNIHNLHRGSDESVPQLVQRVANERRIDLRSAVRLVGESFPELMTQYESGAGL